MNINKDVSIEVTNIANKTKNIITEIGTLNGLTDETQKQNKETQLRNQIVKLKESIEITNTTEEEIAKIITYLQLDEILIQKIKQVIGEFIDQGKLNLDDKNKEQDSNIVSKKQYDNDIKFLMDNGYSKEDAIKLLKETYEKEGKVLSKEIDDDINKTNSNTETILDNKIEASVISKEKYDNDLKYLISQGFDEASAINLLKETYKNSGQQLSKEVEKQFSNNQNIETVKPVNSSNKELSYDSSGNIKGIGTPIYNVITDRDSEEEKKQKQEIQLSEYNKKTQANSYPEYDYSDMINEIKVLAAKRKEEIAEEKAKLGEDKYNAESAFNTVLYWLSECSMNLKKDKITRAKNNYKVAQRELSKFNSNNYSMYIDSRNMEILNNKFKELKQKLEESEKNSNG